MTGCIVSGTSSLHNQLTMSSVTVKVVKEPPANLVFQGRYWTNQWKIGKYRLIFSTNILVPGAVEMCPERFRKRLWSLSGSVQRSRWFCRCVWGLQMCLSWGRWGKFEGCHSNEAQSARRMSIRDKQDQRDKRALPRERWRALRCLAGASL